MTYIHITHPVERAIDAARARIHAAIDARIEIGDAELRKLAQFHRRGLAQRYRHDRIDLIPRRRVSALAGPVRTYP